MILIAQRFDEIGEYCLLGAINGKNAIEKALFWYQSHSPALSDDQEEDLSRRLQKVLGQEFVPFVEGGYYFLRFVTELQIEIPAYKKGDKVKVLRTSRQDPPTAVQAMIGKTCVVKHVSWSDGVVIYTPSKKDWYVFGHDEVELA